MEFFEFLMNEILSLPEVLVGLIVMVGLLLQKADFSKVFSGTTKSIIGFLILGAGAGVIIGSLDALGGIIQDRFNIQGVIPNNEAIVALAQQTLGTETALIMGFGFLANILYARFTPLKYIFLTGHHTFFMAALLSAVLASAGMSGVALVTTGSLILGGVMVLMPALAQPFMRKVTGGNEIAMGHFGTIGYVSAGLVAKAVGNEKKTTEDIKIPEQWSFLRDSLISTALTMVIMFLILVLVAGPEVVGTYAGDQNYIMFGLMQGITFAAGFSIIMYGVRMILTEIVPAFKGIAEKLVPGAKPALDVPIIFPYAPTAVIIGFICSFIGGLIGMFMLGIFSSRSLFQVLFRTFSPVQEPAYSVTPSADGSELLPEDLQTGFSSASYPHSSCRYLETLASKTPRSAIPTSESSAFWSEHWRTCSAADTANK
jgi:ascorbate PTS system EIIC component